MTLEQDITKLTKGIRFGMFAERDSIEEAYAYANSIAKACGANEIGVITAIHVLLNSIAKRLEEALDDTRKST